AELGPGLSRHGLGPAERLLDALADALASTVAGVTRRASVDRRASPIGVLRDVRAHVHRLELVDEVLSIVSLVRSEGYVARPIGPRFDHREGRITLVMTIR